MISILCSLVFLMLGLDSHTLHKWLEEGSVDLTVTRITMHGPPRAGKTCAQKLLLNEPPPEDHSSTPVARSAVRSIRASIDDESELWENVSSEELMEKLASDLNASADIKIPKPVSASNLKLHNDLKILKSKASLSRTVSLSTSESVDKDIVNTPKTVPFNDKIVPAISKSLNIFSDISKHIGNSAKKAKLSKHWIYTIDSGGQPAYQELLPLFVRTASVNVITIDLSKGLTEPFEFKYQIKEKSVKLLGSKITNKQAIEQALPSRTPFIVPHALDAPHSVSLILGTHSDKVSDQTRKEISNELEPLLRNESNFISNGNSYLYPINTQVTDKDERKKAGRDLRKFLMSPEIAKSFLHIKVPIRWFAFELLLEKLGNKERHHIIPKKTIMLEIQQLQMNKEDIEDALKYLHSITIIFYFPNILPDIIFTDPQPILDALSHIIALTYDIDYSDMVGCPVALNKEDVRHLKNHGTITAKLLQDMRLPLLETNLFSPSQFLDLLSYLRIITPVEKDLPAKDCSFFLPCALPSYESELILETHQCKPLLIVWKKENKEVRAVPPGAFPLLIVHLLNNNLHYPLNPDDKQYYRYRDAISLQISFTKRKFYTLHIIKRDKHIEIHFTGLIRNCCQVRKLIESAIIASCNDISFPADDIKPAFACPNNGNCFCIVYEEGAEIACTACSCPIDDCVITNDKSYWCWFTGKYMQQIMMINNYY